MDMNKSFLSTFYFFEYLVDKKRVVPTGSDVSKNITSEQAFEGAIAYLEHHKKELNFDVRGCLELLYDMKNNPTKHKKLWDKWKEIIERSPEFSFSIQSKT
jgi:hypothetical protein